MPKQTYNWKRFWCPRSGNVNLSEGGYLYDPDAEWGKALNPDLVSLEAIADISCLVLLGEPGIGKSRELRELKELTEKRIDDTSQVLALDLRSCTSLKEDLFKDDLFLTWLEGNHHLYLFLDSLDEARLRIPNIATGLVDELKKPKYQNHINRLHLRLTCRTFVFPEILEEELKVLWEEVDFALYELAPLRLIDVIEAAKAEGFSPNDFLNEVAQKDVVPLAVKPITLKFLLNIYRKHGGQFPPNQKRHELYFEGCKLLCEEVNESRHASGDTGNLDSNQRLIVAARIAAVTTFTNRFGVCTGIDQGSMFPEDILLQKLCFSDEEANGRNFEITRKVIEEVLDTGLFLSRGPNRMGWTHQTYAEFLAAWYLVQHEATLEKIKEIFCSSEVLGYQLIPQLYETAGWLASMKLDFFQEIIKTDPDILLQTDVPTDSDIRALIVDNLLTQYEEGKIFNRNTNNYRQYAKLKHPGLADQLRPYICDSSKHSDARDLAIDIAEACKISELQDDLVEIALNSSQSIYLRVSASKAISTIGNKDAKLKLKPLAFENLSEDQDDRLKGYLLRALWPDCLTIGELFQILTPPKKRLFFGSYQYFLEYELAPQIPLDSLEPALIWLKDQGLRYFEHPFGELGDALLFRAWENLDSPRIAEIFAQLVLIQLRGHQSIIIHNRDLKEKFAKLLLQDGEKRHILIEQLVSLIVKDSEETFSVVIGLNEHILCSEDILWMIEKLQVSDSEKIQSCWSKLIKCRFDLFNLQDVKYIDAVIVATQSNDVLRQIFTPLILPIDLHSPQANEMRSYDQERQRVQLQRILLDPPPKQRVLQCLTELDSGNLSAWWQLNREMTLKPESTHYNNELEFLELDLTKLPGWQEAEEATQKRIIEGAKEYIQKQDDIDYDWIGTTTFNRPTIAGCKALKLLLTERLDFLEQLTPEIWQRWAPVIIATPSSSQHEASYLELVKHVYLNAPEEFTQTLIQLIDRENQEYGYLVVINRLDECWDESLKQILLEKSQDSSLNPECVGQLLEVLLQQGVAEARDFARSLVIFPLPSTDDERGKALIAARVLVENSDPSSWSFLWSLIQQDSSFGREVLELVAYRYSHGIQLNLTEEQLADLYIWLVREYPYDQDPDHSNEVMAYSVTARDGIVDLRDSSLTQLKERGTPKACAEIERIIQELPDITWLRRILIDAKANVRRTSWQPMAPEDFLQFVISQEPTNLDLSNRLETIDQRTRKMEDDPKVENTFNISDSPINAPVGNIGEAHSHVTISSSDTGASTNDKKRINWTHLLTVFGIIAGMMVSGAFNEEFRQLFNRVFSPQVEQESTP